MLKFFQKGIELLSYFPNLNCCDFYLWGFIYDKQEISEPKKLKQVIFSWISKSDIQTPVEDFGSFHKRLKNFIFSKGSHFENIVSLW